MNGLVVIAGVGCFIACEGKSNTWAWIFMATGYALILIGLVYS